MKAAPVGADFDKAVEGDRGVRDRRRAARHPRLSDPLRLGHRDRRARLAPAILRGTRAVIIDEAAFHDDLKELMKAALALLMWGGRVLVICTHNGENNAYNALVKEARGGSKGTASCGSTSTTR